MLLPINVASDVTEGALVEIVVSGNILFRSPLNQTTGQGLPLTRPSHSPRLSPLASSFPALPHVLLSSPSHLMLTSQPTVRRTRSTSDHTRCRSIPTKRPLSVTSAARCCSDSCARDSNVTAAVSTSTKDVPTKSQITAATSVVVAPLPIFAQVPVGPPPPHSNRCTSLRPLLCHRR